MGQSLERAQIETGKIRRPAFASLRLGPAGMGPQDQFDRFGQFGNRFSGNRVGEHTDMSQPSRMQIRACADQNRALEIGARQIAATQIRILKVCSGQFRAAQIRTCERQLRMIASVKSAWMAITPVIFARSRLAEENSADGSSVGPISCWRILSSPVAPFSAILPSRKSAS